MTTEPNMTTDDGDDFEAIGTASYSPEDNKLRLSAFSQLDQETYERVKAAGFRWAPKQEIFVAAAWSPDREDLLLELCGEIEDEDYSPTERAADRAERFSDYRDKRAGEALGAADRFDAGPAAFGHQNRGRAERSARRHDRHRTYGVSQWDKAEYWQERTIGVIRHARFKASAHVRRGRILRLESEQRIHEKRRQDQTNARAAWLRVAALDGADKPITVDENGQRLFDTPAGKWAYTLANTCDGSWSYTHPRNPEDKNNSLYDLLTDPRDPITPAEAAAMATGGRDPMDPTTWSSRWSRHYEMRLTYERAMLAEEGGMAGEEEMEVGGFFKGCPIHKINKSPATGRVVSIGVWGPHRWRRNADGTPEMGIQVVKIERYGAGLYRPPTPEEKAAFLAKTKARKDAEKATAPATPSLINPTDADAERLQATWNRHARELYDDYRERHGYAPTMNGYEDTPVRRMTQAEYSRKSAGAYNHAETVPVHSTGLISDFHRRTTTPVMCKVRKTYGPSGGGFSHQANAVVVITDKPQKPLPLDWAAIEAEKATVTA